MKEHFLYYFLTLQLSSSQYTLIKFFAASLNFGTNVPAGQEGSEVQLPSVYKSLIFQFDTGSMHRWAV